MGREGEGEEVRRRRSSRRQVGCGLCAGVGRWSTMDSGMLLLRSRPAPRRPLPARVAARAGRAGEFAPPRRNPRIRGRAPTGGTRGRARRPPPRLPPPQRTASPPHVVRRASQPLPTTDGVLRRAVATPRPYPARGGGSHPHGAAGGSDPACPPRSLAEGAAGAPCLLPPPAPVLPVFPSPNNGRGCGWQHAPAAARSPACHRRASAPRPPSTGWARPGVRGAPPSRRAWRHRRVGRPAARTAAVPPTPALRSAARVGGASARGRLR